MTCFRPSGDVLGIGATTETCTAEDGNQNPADCNFNGDCLGDEFLEKECLAETGHVWHKDLDCDEVLCETIPTVSEWGLIVMTLLGCTVGTLIYGRRRRVKA